MAYNHEYPYVDPNRYNSDWLLNKVKELEGEMSTFEALNKITFDGEWDITKQYAAWTIVNTNNGTEGYISIQPVPAGVLISDTNYWTSVVNYTATIADLQNRVVALEADVAELKSKKRIFAFITDSYGVGSVSDDGTTVISHFKDRLGLTENKDITSIGVGSHGFIANGTNTFLSLLTTLYNRTVNQVTEFTADRVTDVIVVGGDNDNAQTRADLNTAISNFVTASKGYFPNANVWVGEIGNVTATNVHFAIGRTVIPAYKDIVSHGGYYLDGVEKVMLLSDYFMPDGVHPTGLGMEMIAYAIAQALNAGGFEWEIFKTCTPDATGNDFGTNSSTLTATEWSDGERTRIVLNGVVNVTTSVAALTNLKLCDIPDAKVLNGSSASSQATFNGWVNLGGGGTNDPSPATFYIVGKAVYVILGTTKATVTGLQCMYVTFDMPASMN